MAWGSLGIPIFVGFPPAPGRFRGCSGDRFHPPEHPTGSALPSELPWAAAGPSNAHRPSPWHCSRTPAGHPRDVGQAARGRGVCLTVCLSACQQLPRPGGRGFLSRHHPRSILGTGRTGSHALGQRARDGACEEGAAGCPASRESSSAPGGIRIPGRVCLKSLPPSLAGEELLPRNGRMLQAPADEPGGPVAKSRRAAEQRARVPTAATVPARARPVSPPGP